MWLGHSLKIHVLMHLMTNGLQLWEHKLPAYLTLFRKGVGRVGAKTARLQRQPGLCM